MKLYMEFRGCTGGDEAMDFATDLLNVYLKYARKNNIKVELIDNSKTIVIMIEGKEATLKPFLNESGIHKVQRVSKGKLHTSTVSIAVLPVMSKKNINIDTNDLRVDCYRGSGAGGQHRNVTDSAIRITHIPTGTVVTCENERSQYQNKMIAMEILQGKLEQKDVKNEISNRNSNRSNQVKTGDRAESRRTYNYTRNEIVDYMTNKQCTLKEFMDKANIIALCE